jgi:hypothetical protein
MKKTLTTIFCAFALQGCIVEIDPHHPRPYPDIHCHTDWDCPSDSYCETDNYCYEVPQYVMCYSDRDCPIGAFCGLNGLCYENYYY